MMGDDQSYGGGNADEERLGDQKQEPLAYAFRGSPTRSTRTRKKKSQGQLGSDYTLPQKLPGPRVHAKQKNVAGRSTNNNRLRFRNAPQEVSNRYSGSTNNRMSHLQAFGMPRMKSNHPMQPVTPALTMNNIMNYQPPG